jgi:hypothetical protein
MAAFRLWWSVGFVCLLACLGLQAQQPASSETAPNVSGSGKTDFIPIWTNSTTLGNSTVFEKSDKVGIGTTAPRASLEVNGTAKFDQAVTFWSGQTFPGTQPAGSYAVTSGPNAFAGTQTVGSGDLSISNGNLDLPNATGSGIGVINLALRRNL